MKTLLTILSLLPLLTHAHGTIPDIPPDANSREYRNLLQQRMQTLEESQDSDGLNIVLQAGERNLDWLEHINSFLPEGQKLSLTSKETQRGIPITAPSEYSPSLILEKFNKLKAEYPAELAAVVFEGKPFTQTPPIDTKLYIEWSRLLDRQYQSAARWRTMSPWLGELERRRGNDIRGFYFLSRLPESERAQKLNGFAQLPPQEQTQISQWLVGMCLNQSSSLSGCQRRVQEQQQKNALLAYYTSQEPESRETYDSFFSIPSYAPRRDFSWEIAADGSNRLIAPFLDPKKADVQHFLQFNIQEEWKWGNWHLELPFAPSGPHPYVVFKPGVTPNVNGLGGDRITMNANQPLTEYDAQWTIRHEFGHVLGLPDCYVEFYESDRKVIVNYQIDVDNIMCSRKGHVKLENIQELERAYKR